MPMTDYLKTIIYVLKCLEEAITDEYVGSTTNYRARKHAHKSSCNNENSKDHNMKIYQFIRANGGWKNIYYDTIRRTPL
jgi:predicted GIY-YIG superfamily endonuclease